MRLIDLDAIMAQFPDADFDGDVIENMKAYPYWKIGIDGLINVLKAVPIIEQSEDCVKREDAQDIMARLLSDYLHDEDREKIENANAEIGELPPVTPARPHGHWEVVGKTKSKCDNCGATFVILSPDKDSEANFCPNCGADMRESDKND